MQCQSTLESIIIFHFDNDYLSTEIPKHLTKNKLNKQINPLYINHNMTVSGTVCFLEKTSLKMSLWHLTWLKSNSEVTLQKILISVFTTHDDIPDREASSCFALFETASMALTTVHCRNFVLSKINYQSESKLESVSYYNDCQPFCGELSGLDLSVACSVMCGYLLPP